MIYGSPQYRWDDDVTDRIGIRTLTISILWQPSKWPITDEELSAEKPPLPAVSGGVVLVGSRTVPRGGGLRTYWTFEGINGDGKSVTFKDRSNSLDYGFVSGFSEINLLRDPNIQSLMDQYGGHQNEDTIIWDPTIPSSNSGSSGAVKADNNAGKPNPLFGETSRFRMDGTYHFRYAVRDPSEVPDIGGKIFTHDQLPGRPPKPKNCNWLAMQPSPERRGPVWEVTESYWLSGDGGWPDPIYNPKKTSSGSGSGLTTGTLTTGTL